MHVGVLMLVTLPVTSALARANYVLLAVLSRCETTTCATAIVVLAVDVHAGAVTSARVAIAHGHAAVL